jgi:hypothetical protein
MTNKDLMNTLNEFEKDGTPPTKKNSEEVYGPKTVKGKSVLHDYETINSDTNEVSAYPDIYGPEITPVPGKSSEKYNEFGKGKEVHSEKYNEFGKGKEVHSEKYNEFGKQVSDFVDPNEPTYQFNPDFKKAFPHDKNEPQPFLSDFSKFQR